MGISVLGKHRVLCVAFGLIVIMTFSDGNAKDGETRPVIVQVRDEVYLPEGSTSKRVDDYAAIVKDGWYYSADDSFRLRVPTLGSGKVSILRRRWENPDGIDVKFVDEDAYWRAVFSIEPGHTPNAHALKKKYADYLATQNTMYKVAVITTEFGDTTETIAMNWVSPSNDYPYEPPTIDDSPEKMAKVGPTVGIGWTWWKGKSQYGFWMIIPVDAAIDESGAFRLAKAHIKDFAAGLVLKENKQ